MIKFNLEMIPSPVGKYVNAQDYDDRMEDLIALENALRNVQKLICEGAKEGFNCHAGDWAEKLFHSQQMTSKALDRI